MIKKYIQNKKLSKLNNKKKKLKKLTHTIRKWQNILTDTSPQGHKDEK